MPTNLKGQLSKKLISSPVVDMFSILYLHVAPHSWLSDCFTVLPCYQGTNVAAGKASGVVVGTGLNTQIGKKMITDLYPCCAGQ